MKFLKLTHSLLAAVLLAVAASSCGDDDDDDSSGPLTVTPSDISMPSYGGRINVHVSKGYPCVSADMVATWLSVDLGNGQSITVIGEPNTTGKPRTGYIQLYNSKGNSTGIRVDQQAGSGGSDTPSGSIAVFPTEVTISANGGSTKANVVSGGPCTSAITNVTWVNASVSGGSAITINVEPNKTGITRSTKVAVYNEKGATTSIAVRQEAGTGGGTDPGTDPNPGTSAPAAPTGLYVSGSGSAAIPNCTLKWNASSGAKSYIIYRSTREGSGYSQIGTSQYASYVDETVKIGNTYYYRVKAKNGKGTSDYSNTCVYEFSDKRKPGPAKITSATCSGSNITVRWSVPTDQTYGKPTSGSIMVADPAQGGNAVEVKSFSGTTTSATFSYRQYVASATGGVTFSVRLSNEHGYSDSVVIYDTKNNKFYYN